MESVTSRNYQIDILKLALSLFVFLAHTNVFINPNTSIRLPESLGWVSVHFFFMISGFLMIKSSSKINCSEGTAGKCVFEFVINKFKKISVSYWIATILLVIVNCLCQAHLHNPLKINEVLIKMIPELLAVNNAGVLLEYNSPVWYISAMLLVMLPLSYLLIRNKDLYIYIFSPVAALFLQGYLYMQGGFTSRIAWQTIVFASIIRAACGISFGGIAFIIYERLCSFPKSKTYSVLITITEIMLNVIFFLYVVISRQFSRYGVFCYVYHADHYRCCFQSKKLHISFV